MIREDVILNGCETISLPIVTMSNGITIRLLDLYDMTNAAKVVNQCLPTILSLKAAGFETIVTPATKPIPVAWSLACSERLNFVVLKKEVKPYYKKFKEFTCKSITSDSENTMYITEEDYSLLANKKVIFFDDVLSTGATFEGSKKFLKEQCNIDTLFSLFVLKEGTSYKTEDKNIKWLGEIPI
jgi:adenine/guanine phosphoribosyltransferase-like PRPP-binding protein